LKFLADETGEHRRDEALEPGSFLVDRRLIVVGRGDDRVHHCVQQPALPRVGVDRRRVATHRGRVAFDRLLEHCLPGEVLVAKLGIVDQILVVGDNRARLPQHLRQALGDHRVLLGRRIGCERRGSHQKHHQ